jgi:chromosome segregation protein
MLKRIEMSGFKSFAKKTALDFTTPVTAVVGPNGSGKSNIVEAMRFVLGEQSMKSLRGKSGSDLIFKGSKTLSAQNRAKVAMVFDNSRKLFRIGSESGISLDFDEVEIAREIYSDGGSKYTVNGTEVRLKDIVELLSSVNIGASGHHIISQGEADRILSSSPKDRREMIEDALGLKIYQYRLRESERKLEKSEDNMKEVEALRREIAPHLRFLKKQVEKLEHAEELKKDLSSKYKTYLSLETKIIEQRQEEYRGKSSELKRELTLVSEKLKMDREDDVEYKDNTLKEEERRLENAVLDIRAKKEEIQKKFTRTVTLLEILERDINREKSNKSVNIVLPRESLLELKSSLWNSFDIASREDDISKIRTVLSQMKSGLDVFWTKYLEKGPLETDDTEKKKEEYESLKKSLDQIEADLASISEKEKELDGKTQDLKLKYKEETEAKVLRERSLYDLRVREREISSELSLLSVKEDALSKRVVLFEEEIKEGNALIGGEILLFRHKEDYEKEEDISDEAQDNRRKYIERLKIKLEEYGGQTGQETFKEYEEVSARDAFLAKELDDLEKSIASMKDVVRELRITIEREFKLGIEKINKQFQDFFALMFGGGHAYLSVVLEEKRRKKGEDEEDSEISMDDEEKIERGIEINISLPQKKVKELMMLSGGERSLTSIALLFAMSQVNPPPFLVLDETDAALDEANSRRYGDMLELLSKYSELIVVTHNRETMSRAQVLYGVTLGSDTCVQIVVD